jgi:hypothetical protein
VKPRPLLGAQAGDLVLKRLPDFLLAVGVRVHPIRPRPDHTISGGGVARIEPLDAAVVNADRAASGAEGGNELDGVERGFHLQAMDCGDRVAQVGKHGRNGMAKMVVENETTDDIMLMLSGVSVEYWPSSREGVRVFSNCGKVGLQMRTSTKTTSAYLNDQQVQKLLDALERVRAASRSEADPHAAT